MDQSTEKTITFYDNFQPGLKAGSYRLRVSQSLTADGQPVGASAQYLSEQAQCFDVRGPRFSLPSQDLHSVYPPDGGRGPFGEVLPQLVLTQPTLPWERDLGGGDSASATPWLALLLLRESELSATGPLQVQTSTVGQFLAPETGVLKPSLDDIEPGSAQAQETCRNIRIPSALFSAIAPTYRSDGDNELRYLAHCRSLEAATNDDPADGSVYAVVIGKRLAVADGRGTSYRACLVSLEGLQGSLPPAAISESEVALILLYSWSFTSVPRTGKHFSTLAEHLAGEDTAADTPRDPDSLLLRVPIDASQSGPAAGRIRDGYVPLAHLTSVGATTFAWYRGPLTPVPAQPLPEFAGDEADFSVDSWRIYDPAHALFDQSYAAAWQLGRALALADGVFAADILRLRNALNDAASTLDARLCYLAERAPADPSALLAERGLRRHLDGLLHDPRTWAAPGTAATRPPVRPAPRAVAVVAARQRTLLTQPEVRAALGERLAQTQPDALTRVQAWLGELMRLESLPFWHLVPDNAMLPNESLRFFFVDPGWLDALRAGALSIGIQSSKDVTQHAGLIEAVGDAPRPVAGFLLRSALVSTFPNLVVAAGAGTETPTLAPVAPLTPLSKRNPAPDLLLCLYTQQFDALLLGEPKHTLCFGVEDDGAGGCCIALRHLSGDVGAQLMDTSTGTREPVELPMSKYIATAPYPGVLYVADLVANLETGALAGELGDSGFTAADLAIEMLRAPEAIQLEAPQSVSTAAAAR